MVFKFDHISAVSTFGNFAFFTLCARSHATYSRARNTTCPHARDKWKSCRITQIITHVSWIYVLNLIFFYKKEHTLDWVSGCRHVVWDYDTPSRLPTSGIFGGYNTILFIDSKMAVFRRIGSDIVLISMICTLLKTPISGIVDFNTTTWLLHDKTAQSTSLNKLFFSNRHISNPWPSFV